MKTEISDQPMPTPTNAECFHLWQPLPSQNWSLWGDLLAEIVTPIFQSFWKSRVSWKIAQEKTENWHRIN
jgi:hypothetical protein